MKRVVLVRRESECVTRRIGTLDLPDDLVVQSEDDFACSPKSCQVTLVQAMQIVASLRENAERGMVGDNEWYKDWGYGGPQEVRPLDFSLTPRR